MSQMNCDVDNSLSILRSQFLYVKVESYILFHFKEWLQKGSEPECSLCYINVQCLKHSSYCILVTSYRTPGATTTHKYFRSLLYKV